MASRAWAITIAALAAVLIGPASPAQSQQAPIQAAPPAPPQAAPAPDDESTVVSALEVVAHPPGPALWRVKRGDSEVVILGAYSPLPHLLNWNHVRLDRALDGATGFYETKATINPLELAALFFDQGSFKIGGGRTLDQVIGPARQARLQVVAAVAHADPKRMQPFKPAIAGIFAYQTFLRAAGLSAEKPSTTIRKLVEARHVPQHALAKLGGMSIIRSIQHMNEAAQLACFDAALDQTNWESGHAVAAAQAWADGHVSELRKLQSTAILDRCLDSGGAKAVLEKGITDAVDSIEELLAKPGRKVAVTDINFLMAKNGVLDRLQQKGAEISLPPP